MLASWLKKNCKFANRTEDLQDLLLWGDLPPEQMKALRKELAELTKPVSQSELNHKKDTLMLYHGFNNLQNIKKDNYTLDPKKSEQGVLWFTHQYQKTNSSPIEYASSKGNYLLSYPIEIDVFWFDVTQNNGNVIKKSPENMACDPTENCNTLCLWDKCIKLPPGFSFSYKNEKFIVCERPIHISPSMIQHTEGN